MGRHQGAHDGKAQTETFHGPARPAVFLAEAVEDVGQEVGVDADAGVAYADSALAVQSIYHDGHDPPPPA